MTGATPGSRNLTADVATVSAIDRQMRRAMFDLYARYYAPAYAGVFESDLLAKTHVLLLQDDGGALRGFSTIRVWRTSYEGRPFVVLYSGDTIIDQPYWGSQALPFRWLEFAGAVKAENPSLPLYWLLISKGHRTYRLLTSFARTYFPSRRWETPEDMARLMGFAGETMFMSRFDEATGIVRTDGGAALRTDFAGMDGARAMHPDVAHFTRLNPGYASGDELLCLCELSEENLHPIARTQFLRGHERAALGTAA